MREKLIKFVYVIIIISLIVGVFQNLFSKDESKVYEKIEKENTVLVPEHYTEDQMAFINFEKVYNYFPSIKGAEQFKKDLSVNLKEKSPQINTWFVTDISYVNNVLNFRVEYNNVSYMIKINEYQTMIVRE